MLAQQMNLMWAIIVRVLVSFSLVSCSDAAVDRKTTHARLVELVPIDVDRKESRAAKLRCLDAPQCFSVGVERQTLRRVVGSVRWPGRPPLRGLRPRLLAVGEHAAGTRRRLEGSR